MTRKEHAKRLAHHNWGRMSPELAPTVRARTSDYVWAAGIYEGEGSCSRRKYGTHIVVAQKRPWLPRKLRALFGGSVTKRRGGGLSNGYMYYWVLCGKRGREFMKKIYPRLSPWRKRQASQARMYR